MTNEKKSGTRDYRKRLTELLIEGLEENDGLPWERGWHQIRPFNPTTGIKYKGGNVVNLMLAQLEKGSDDPRWMTLKQANLAGYSIRKGAQATHIEYWNFGQLKGPRKKEVDENGVEIEKENTDDVMPRSIENPREKPSVFFPAVFNGADIVGLPEFRRDVAWVPNELAERLIAATGANIEHTTIARVGSFGIKDNAAFYHPTQDRIVLPPRNQFKSDGDYYATALHELAHWTGHTSRLNRLTGSSEQYFGKPEYAKEELRADIAAMFLCSLLGVEGKVQNHAKYTASWLETLKNDKHEIFRASRDAELIVEHLLDYAPELRVIMEGQLSDNLIPKEAPPKKLGSGISADLPNFVPVDAPPAPTGVGRADHRWSVCERAIRDQAKKYEIDVLTVNNALSMIEGQFTELMNKAEENGYSATDMSDMLATKIVDEMRTADQRQTQWIRFCELVRINGKEHSSDFIEIALQEASLKYKSLIAQSNHDNWSDEQTNQEIAAMIYGEQGKRHVNAEFVGGFIRDSVAVQELIASGSTLSGADTDDADDFMLEPMGMAGELPDDPGAMADEFIMGGSAHSELILDDAEMQGP